MIKTVFNSETVFLLNDEWDDGNGFQATFSLLRDEQSGLTQHEGRRPYSATLRAEVSFGCVPMEDALLELQGNLRQMTTEPVVVPLWPTVCLWQDRAGQKIKGGLMVAFKDDWSQFEIYLDGAEPGWPAANDLCAPALFGFLRNQGSGNGPQLLDPTFGKWQVDFVESSPVAYALKVTAAAPAAGPQPPGYAAAPIVLPLLPDFNTVKEDLRVVVGRQSIGLDREQAATFYPHEVYRGQSATYTLRGGLDEISILLSWFLTVGGPGASFWAANGAVMGNLSAAAGAGAVALLLENAAAWQLGDYVAAFSGEQLYFAEVNTVAGNTLNLVGGVGVALKAGDPLFGLFLARLDKAELLLSWAAPHLARATVTWSEVRPEKAIPLDETLGTTIGKLPLRVVLFKFMRDFGNGTVSNWYFTSYEGDINWSGHAWLHGSFGLKKLTSSLNLEDDSCQIDSFIEAGNPLNDDLALNAEAPLQVQVWLADYDGVNVTNAVVQFLGDCTDLSRDGNKITAMAKFGPAFFDTDLPRFVRGTICNHIGGSNNDGSFLISAGCTLLKADWKCTGTVAAPVSAAFPPTLHVAGFTKVGAGVAAATVQASFFVNGWIEWGAGASIQRRLIVASTAPVAGAIDLTLHRYFKTPPLPTIGDAVVFYPGCDGRYETCKAYDASTNPDGRFSNDLNFGAEPFSPSANPSTAGQPNLNVSGGKK